MNVKQEELLPLFSLAALNEFKEEKYDLKPLSKAARNSIANDFLQTFAVNKKKDGVIITTENYLHKEDKILSILRERERKRKKPQDVQKTFLKDSIRWKSLHDNAQKGNSALAIYLFNALIKTVRKLILDSITDDEKITFKPSKQLIELLGDNELSTYILSMQIMPYSRLVEYCCKDKNGIFAGTYFHASDDAEVLQHSGEFSVSELMPQQTGRTLYLKSMPDTIRQINDFAVICTRAIIVNTLQNSTNEVLKCSLEAFVKSCMQSFYGLDLTKEVVIQMEDNVAESICQKFKLAYTISSHVELKKNTFSTKTMPYNFEFALQMLKIIPVKTKDYLGHRAFKSGYAYKVASSDICLSEQLYILLKQIYLDEEDSKYDRNVSSLYAKSYITKKNIPPKILDAMKNSTFNNYFGYVEFDGDSDVQKIMELEKEWEAINNHILPQPKKELVSLRFRKLGNHNAIGLYYPKLQCICVDVRQPSSFTHEYFHMLDYTLGKLSSTYEFSKVYDVYAPKLTKLVDERKIPLSGKYDLLYYLTRTEVFARCAEIYLTRCLKIDNSLCRYDASIGFAYPDDPELEICIKTYFDMFMQKYCAKEEKNNEKQ